MIDKKPAYNTLPGSDDVTRIEFSNGITLLVRSNFLSSSVLFKGYLNAGSILDPDKKLGLSNLTAASMTTGTKEMDFNAIHNTIETLGANLSIQSGTLSTSFSCQCLSEDLKTMMSIFSDILQKPSFPIKQFKRLKAQYLTMLAIMAQDTSEMADKAFNELLFKGHPYERSDDGTPESIKAIGIEDLIEFYTQYYSPQGMVIAIVGAISPENASQIVNEFFEQWNPSNKASKVHIPDAIPLENPARKHVIIPEKSQTDIIMGNLAPRRSSKDYLPCVVGNNILGQFGMMGRIGQSVREKYGLAYYAESELTSGIGPGTWACIAGINPENISKVIGLIQDEIKHFLNEPVSDTELDDSKSYLIGRLPLLHQSNSGVAVSLLNIERYNLGLNYLHQYADNVLSVSKEDILMAARKYLLLQSMVTTSAGKAL